MISTYCWSSLSQFAGDPEPQVVRFFCDARFHQQGEFLLPSTGDLSSSPFVLQLQPRLRRVEAEHNRGKALANQPMHLCSQWTVLHLPLTKKIFVSEVSNTIMYCHTLAFLSGFCFTMRSLKDCLLLISGLGLGRSPISNFSSTVSSRSLACWRIRIYAFRKDDNHSC